MSLIVSITTIMAALLTFITISSLTSISILTVETDIFEENVTNSNQLYAYIMNTSATEMYDGREIYSIRELTILPENVNSQRARAIGNVSIKLPSPEQVIILDYRRTSQTEPVTTTAADTTTATSAEQSTTQSEVKPTVQPTAQPATMVQSNATIQSTPDLPSSGSCDEIAPVMRERAFYN